MRTGRRIHEALPAQTAGPAACRSRSADRSRPDSVIYGIHPIESAHSTSSTPFPSGKIFNNNYLCRLSSGRRSTDRLPRRPPPLETNSLFDSLRERFRFVMLLYHITFVFKHIILLHFIMTWSLRFIVQCCDDLMAADLVVQSPVRRHCPPRSCVQRLRKSSKPFLSTTDF